MAGNSLRRLRSWISIAILSGCYLLPRGEYAPCTSYPSNTTWDARVTIFLRGRCDGELDVGEIEDFVQQSDFAADVIVTPTAVTCETQDKGLSYLLNVLEQGRTRALVAALDYSVCEIVVKFAGLWNVPLLTWTCPLRELSKEEEEEEQEGSSVIRLSPSFPSMANALAETFQRLGWRTVIIVGTDREPWSSFERNLIHRLRRIGIGLRYRTILPYRASLDEVRKLLRPAHGLSRKATLICLPTIYEDESISHVLAELDGARRTSNSLSNSMIVMIQPEENDAFLPRSNLTDDSSLDSSIPVSPSSSTSSNFSTFNVTYKARWSTSSLLDDYDSEAVVGEEKEIWTGMEQEDGQETRFDRRFYPSKNLSAGTLASLLAIMPFDQRYDVERLYNGTEEYARPSLLDRLNESLTVLTRDNGSIDARNNKMYTYALLDWCDGVWRPIMLAIERQETLYFRKLSPNAAAFRFAENSEPPECDVDVNVECEANVSQGSSLHATHIVATVLGSLLITTLAIASAILIRKRLLNKRMSKGPYKIILTMSDFVFPQVAQIDSKRVDEGIETMLCCWLQQLEKFGGPEVDKPDLLQLGSVGSLMPYLQAGSGNLARHTFLKDPRARYNGDLVQLKELPGQGNFELKNKAMDVLVTIHGLRHENLNPLIGFLNEPARPYLVYEYCSRGSLQDVLVQDEIKLDWSFRLSLLTDLVRGMRYLHGTPIRVHGYLTSRNCVIDARWVLKVTDYGLPAFYEAQNVSIAAKTARGLLWTAPELLRHPSLRKKGTQPGDVYSFGIIMQEVVVRGEPFCMLALSPEDIIEKVMKPPPLIRPSVSKGAAPPEAINIMRQCWAEAADMRPDFDDVHDLFKKLNHGRKVNFVDTMFQMLEKYSNNLEELIRERTEQLDMEKKKTEQLLNRMLPSSVAEKLKLGMPVDPEEFREVTIYFSDIVGFTTISAHSTPFQVVDLLNDLYTCFDATINAYTVYKVETIGDAYMVVGGCPVRIPDHASQIATMALDLLHQSGKFKLKHLPKTQLRLRIGLHTGPCCAGVVGLTMPRYCLFGDTVNTASRMESTGAPWRIHLSQATRDRLCEAGGYDIEYRGRTDVKGKGKMPTYWLLGKQGFDKELPTPPPLGENHGLHESLIAESMVNEEPPESPERQNASTAEVHPLISSGESGRGEKPGTEDNGKDTRVVSQVAVAVALDEDVAAVIPTEEGGTIQTTASSGFVKSAADFADLSSPRKTTDERTPTARAPSAPRSTSGDTQASLGISSISGSYAEPTAAPSVLGASSTSLASVASSSTIPYRPGQGPSWVSGPGQGPGPGPGPGVTPASARHRRIAGFIDENDLSSPYNHYRCLSPNDQHGRSSGCRLLKRQFSLDRADEPISLGFSEMQYHHQLQQQQQKQPQTQLQQQPQQQQQQQQQQNLRTTPRLYKQNSAGAANDLERIEEVPSTPGHKPFLHNYRHAASVSLSVESLSLH